MVHVRERNPPTFVKLLETAEVYREAHSDRRGVRKQGQGSRSEHTSTADKCSENSSKRPSVTDNTAPKEAKSSTPEPRECFLCHRKGHIARNCRTKPLKMVAMISKKSRNSKSRPDNGKQSSLLGEENVLVVAAQGIVSSGSLPVADGWIGQRKVKVLRDTGCSEAVI